MRIEATMQILVLALLLFSMGTKAGENTFNTKDSSLLDPCGETLVIRGVNAGIAFPPDPRGGKLPEMAKTGANAVRLTFRWRINKSTPNGVDRAIRKAVGQNMVAIPSLWDATGSWEELQFVVDFWSQPEIVEILRRYEDMILLNIANEAGDEKVSQEDYRKGYSSAIKQLRKAGLHMPLVIDAADWGRQESYLLKNAQYLLSQDPDKNLMFSWHPWNVDQSQAYYKKTIDAAIALKIPLLIGEFAQSGAHHEGKIDYEYLMEYAEKQKTAWLWWWWDSGEPIDSHSLTMNGVYGRWANKGQEIVETHPASIKNTSKHTHYTKFRECKGGQEALVNTNPPSELKASSTKGAEVLLEWKDNSADEKSFDIELLDKRTKKWRLVKVVDPDLTSTLIGADLAYIYSMSPIYNKSLAYEVNYTFRVGAYRSNKAVSYSEPVTITTLSDPRLCLEGDGLNAKYFALGNESNDFSDKDTPSLTRIDPTIRFNWGKKSPDLKLPSDHFSVRWTGYVVPQFSGTYTFYTNSDDFVRLWVDKKQIIDKWRSFDSGWAIGKVDLEAGKKYSISMDYGEWDSKAKVELQWASSQLRRETIPQCRLFSK